MCTRYFINESIPELEEMFQNVSGSKLASRFVDKFARPVIIRGEVRPTDIVPVIAPSAKGLQSAFPMQWGFSGHDGRRSLFNARVETAGSKPTFNDAWKSHRCIIPASYYFEWEHFKSPDGKIKTGDKYAIQPAGNEITYLCGLYRIEDGFPVFVILTKEPTDTLRKIHDRMPLILPAEMIDEWINPYSDPNITLEYALADMVVEKSR